MTPVSYPPDPIYTRHAKMLVVLTTVLGASGLIAGLHPFEFTDKIRFLSYMALGLSAVGMRVVLPTITGTLSVNFLFILIGLAELSLSELLALGTGMTFVQILMARERRPGLVKAAYNVSVTVISIHAVYAVFHFPALRAFGLHDTPPILAACFVLFFTFTIPVAVAIAWTENKRIWETWRECSGWALPYYMVGAAVAWLFTALSNSIGWQLALLLLPVFYLMTRSYQLHMARVDDSLRHAEQMANLHLRTIEALALAIEAKDSTTAEHLERVQTYALEIGKELGLSRDELEALRAASLLHDIGKLAVPEHILSKPGKLTPDEFEKMKIHPIVGAEIVERANFPYPVAPIVRSHHERWNGDGYPDGLRGEQIPIGARILSAVDCFDALSTDRQYRRGLPLAEALAFVDGEAGQAFDPKVVAILKRRVHELEKKVKANAGSIKELSTNVIVSRGKPAAGFAEAAGDLPMKAAPIDVGTPNFLDSIAAARLEVLTLFELSNDLGSSLSLQETLSVLATRLKRLVPYDSLAIYFVRGRSLVPEYVTGENHRLFNKLEIPIGQGLSGWVAERRQPILNGNPSVEPGYLNDPTKFSTLRAALAVPLEATDRVVGVMALYHSDKDFYSRDHLRILNAISAKLSNSIESLLKVQAAETTATTDFLTGLPNARSLFGRLEEELAHCRRSGMPLDLLVCDLNGFKMVNDRFGHLEGNRVLREVAMRLRELCRDYDYVARMGGDEFVLLLPGLPQGSVNARMAELTQLVTDAGRMITGENALSCAVGHARFPDEGADSETLFVLADQRMYRAKRQMKGESHSTPPGDVNAAAFSTAPLSTSKR